MIKEIRFAEATHYKGRNGVGNQVGIQILDTPNFPIQLRPINSRDETTESCLISVSRDALPALIDQLTQIANEEANAWRH